jgi:hypothetical protein
VPEAPKLRGLLTEPVRARPGDKESLRRRLFPRRRRFWRVLYETSSVVTGGAHCAPVTTPTPTKGQPCALVVFLPRTGSRHHHRRTGRVRGAGPGQCLPRERKTEHSSFDLTGAVFSCNSRDITVTGGTVDQGMRSGLDSSGAFHFTETLTPHDVAAQDANGAQYRHTGASHVAGKVRPTHWS